MDSTYEKPLVKLTGKDGNAFAIISRVRQAMRRAGATKEEVDNFISEATSGDYDNLLSTCFKYVEIH